MRSESGTIRRFRLGLQLIGRNEGWGVGEEAGSCTEDKAEEETEEGTALPLLSPVEEDDEDDDAESDERVDDDLGVFGGISLSKT